jgi:hypothetical protein
MNLLVDINHPGHIHLFKGFIREMVKRNHAVFITAKANPIIVQLLKSNDLSFASMGKGKDTFINKIFKQFKDSYKILRFTHEHKIDIGIGVSISIPQASLFSKFKSIMLDDDDDLAVPFVAKFVHPIADCILSPDVLKGSRKSRSTRFYAGYHELAYLHPNNFKPDPTILKQIGLRDGEMLFILRFNAFKAHHDIGIKGLTLEQKLTLIKELSPKGKILITTERTIEPELSTYQLRLPPDKIHSLLYYASMFIGDSQTMTSESAVLGTPALRCNSFAGRISYLEEEEKKYGLTFGFKPDEFPSLINKMNDILAIPNFKEEWQQRRQKMLADKIDVTAFLVWFVENYPESARIMQENPDYQNRFK